MATLVVNQPSNDVPLYTCSVCKNVAVRNEVHDAYACKRCDEWLEPRCSDPNCGFCADRPTYPSLVGYEEEFFDEIRGDICMEFRNQGDHDLADYYGAIPGEVVMDDYETMIMKFVAEFIQWHKGAENE